MNTTIRILPRPTTSRLIFVCMVVLCAIFLLSGDLWHFAITGTAIWMALLLRKAYALPPKKPFDMKAHMRECALRDAARSARRSHMRYEDDQRRDPEGKRYSGPPPLP